MSGNEMGMLWFLAAALMLVLVGRRDSVVAQRTAAINRVEAKLDLLLSHAGIQYDPYAGIPQDVVQSLQKGNKVQAIKLYRQSSGATLKDAVDFIEELQRRSGAGGG